MRFYNQQHKFYCGIDLHARKMYVCIIDQKGKTRVHQNITTDPELLFDIICQRSNRKVLSFLRN
jgi:predicted NBD/HSP70 family sugar kinase